jgi:hypothetical protein
MDGLTAITVAAVGKVANGSPKKKKRQSGKWAT